MQCELCGGSGNLVKARIEGVILTVCTSCSVLGEAIATPVQPKRKITAQLRQETVYTIAEGYSELIKKKREGLLLSQEDFAKKINEKISVIHNLESGKLEPSIDLARKLERSLGIRLVEENQVMRDTQVPGKKGIGLTIGDVISLRRQN